ncbi:MAG: TrkA family potassium uptake protein, partial [Leptolyngbyaceae cyanobacterium SL_5_14]|nr:TrkA family potassium uptake protein [Leptolyngbyaceae cyanobacterium SL_5_14]
LATRLTLKRVLSLAPDLDTIVRAHINQEIDVLYQLGAQEVVQPEFEAALEMGAHLLLNLGSQPTHVLKMINTYRARRYRDILPQRAELVSTDLETAMEGLQGEWYALVPSSPLNGLTLAEADIRHKTGVTIMAIRRGKEINRYPDASTLLLEGDRLLGVGSPPERAAFKNLISGIL